MQTYITRKEHEAAGDYSGPVIIRGHYYTIAKPPVFEEIRDTAQVEAILLPDPPVNAEE
jgi:hypothetical protein